MRTPNNDYFETLGVKRDATTAEIKKAYRKLARKFHPDVNPGDEKSAEKFKEINEAFQVLSDEKKRKQYEQYGTVFPEGVDPETAGFGQGGAGGGPGGYRTYSTQDVGDLDDLFQNLFGGFGQTEAGPAGRGRSTFGFGARQPQPRKGQDIEADLKLTLEEAASGVERELTLTLQEPCARCSGSGQTEGGLCPECHGAGFSTSPRKLKVRVPKGVTEGSRVRLAGQGGPGAAGGPKGDLFLRTHLAPHPTFRAEGHDLYVNVPVSFAQAALGGEARVPTLTGSVKLKLSAGTQGGQKFRLKGLGLPGRGKEAGGDLYAVIAVKVPKELTEEQRNLLEQLDDSLGESS